MSELKIGTVIRVTGGRVDVLITARDLNVEHEGRTHRIGQLGTYVTIPFADHSIVGFVTGSGRVDHGSDGGESKLVVNVQLVGEIANGRFSRGVNEYPIVDDEVRLAVRGDFEAIFGSFDEIVGQSDQPQSFPFGRFALSTDFEVKVLGSEFFAKHAAVVGNSGSGKSCTTAKNPAGGHGPEPVAGRVVRHARRVPGRLLRRGRAA